ncbi:thioredoxin domain-containing protein 16-like [Saccostrea echinata]|uniref:thioredoxin domain-containing protein 16-like n=1 Tax=Saccostrea echinata TaxID=191078 RepID=UPI002A7F207D|nr:thioredoxin domain-containing protein 16-like [Saccostrea echinata]
MRIRNNFLTVQLLTLVCESVAVGFTVDQFNHAKLIKKEDLPGFKQSKTVSVLYYYKEDNPRHRSFYREYDKSAEYLGLYDLKLGVVNCKDPANFDVDRCTEGGTEASVYTYSNGNELLALEIETMFDVNSMMSNILQLALLREVPILQSQEERENFINKHKGTRDIVFSFQKAIGTYEHRIFMEVAYAFHHKFQFAISTATKAVTGLVPSPETLDDARVWFLMCSQVTNKEDDCFIKFYDDKMDLSSLASFMRRLDTPPNFDIPGDGTTHPYTPDLGLHLVYLFYRESTKDTVDELIRLIGNQFHGTAAFITINVETTLPEVVGLDAFPPSTPEVAVQLKSEKNLVHMTEAWSLDSAFEFFASRLHEYEVRPKEQDRQGVSDVTGRDMEGQTYPEGEVEEKDRYSEEIETEDDQVAEAIQRARRIQIDLELAERLTDKTFSTTIKERDIVFTLFFLPFDHRSLAFLRAYGEAARKFENQTDRPFTFVNCHDWTDVCAKENITHYPILKIYRQGKFLKDYDSMLSIEDVVNAYKFLKQEKPVSLADKEEIEKFFNGVLPDGSNITGSVSVVALFADQKKGVQTFEEMARSLGDKFTFGINSNGQGKDFAKKYGCSDLPCVVILRRNDLVQPYVTYRGDLASTEELFKFMEKSLTPSLAELTPSIFPRLYKQNKPFVISFVDDTESSKQLLEPIQSLVKAGTYPDVIFCLLQSGDINSFGRQILQTYQNSTSSSVPALSYAHLKEGKVYNYLDKSFTKEQIEAWLKDIQTQSIDDKTLFLLKDGMFKPRLQGYHFLEFIKESEEEKKRSRARKEDPDVLTANVHGIGFDSEGNEVDPRKNEDNKREETVDDSEIRRELIELQKSRLYHHAEGKHKPPHRKSDDHSDTSKYTSEALHVPHTSEAGGSGYPAPEDTKPTSDGSTASPSKKTIIHDDL